MTIKLHGISIFNNSYSNHLIMPPVVVRRLVVDPIYAATGSAPGYWLFDYFGDAIKYLLTATQEELIDNFQNPYVVEYSELRPYLLEKRLSVAESKGRRKFLCPGGDCIFKYSEALILHHDDDDGAAPASSNLTYCGVCEKQVVSETPAYTCRKCTLTLHKSCAERVDFKACGNAGEDFNGGFGSRLFKTNLKCSPLPTIIEHDFHQHFLSLNRTKTVYFCNACGKSGQHDSYRCVQCASFYHLECAFLPLELLKHKHGGHEHVTKLMYSLHEDGMEQDETYWCEVCYKDMDPEAGCYLCQNCPYYVTHVYCAGADKFLHNPKDVKLVQQLQPQLEDAFPEIFRAE